MGSNIGKTPIFAVVYAATLSFVAALLPYSDAYTQAREGFSMPLSGNLFLLLYGLWTAFVAVLIFSSVRIGAGRLISLIFSFAGASWLQMLLYQLFFGQPTRVMTRGDTGLSILAGSLSVILLLLLCLWACKQPPDTDKQQPQFKVVPLRMFIWALVLPVLYTFLYLITWYFFIWSQPEANSYFLAISQSADSVTNMVNLLTTILEELPFSLLQGLLFVGISIPLITSLAGRRGLFITVNTMLYLTVPLWQLIPNPIVASTKVRMLRLGQYGVTLLLFGIASALFLQMALRKIEVKPPAQEQKPVPGRPQAPARRPAAPVRR